MFYQEFKPSERLTNFIKCFWVLVQPFSKFDREPELILPDGCPEIIFNFGVPFKRHYSDKVEIQSQSILAGQLRQHILIEPSRSVNIFGVRFQPNGMYPFVKHSLDGLTGKVECFDTVLGRSGRALEEKIFEAHDVYRRINIFENAMIAATDGLQENILVSQALETIRGRKGLVKISELVKELGTNSKTLERQFRREIGLTPKLFGRIIRFQEILQSLNGEKATNWADTAYAFGYVDQAHFIKDFKEFSGITPTTFSRQNNSLSDAFVG